MLGVSGGRFLTSFFFIFSRGSSGGTIQSNLPFSVIVPRKKCESPARTGSTARRKSPAATGSAFCASPFWINSTTLLTCGSEERMRAMAGGCFLGEARKGTAFEAGRASLSKQGFGLFFLGGVKAAYAQAPE